MHVKLVGKVVPPWILALITVSIAACSVIALQMFSQYKISYLIQPATETPSLTPNPVTLDLGTIASGSTGEKDFGKTATMSLPAGYEITFKLDTTTISDFNDFHVDINAYETGTTNWVRIVSISKHTSSYSSTFNAGDYDLHVKIYYTANSVTTEINGEVIINLSWPQ